MKSLTLGHFEECSERVSLRIIEARTRVNKRYNTAIDEASRGPRPPRGTAASGKLFMWARGDRSSWEVLGGWRSPEDPRRQQRRGYSDRNSERSRDGVGARVVCDVKRGENLGFSATLCTLFRRRR